MTEERCLRVPYHVVGAATGWVLGVALMAAATVDESEFLAGWALVAVTVAAVWTVSCMLRVSRDRLLDAFELQLRMHGQLRDTEVSRIPGLR